MISAIEGKLCAIEGLDSKEAAARSGRREGVRYCWKNALGDVTAEVGKTTYISTAWSRSATWLKDIANTKYAKVANVAAWKLLHYTHPQPDPAKATLPQLDAMHCFSAWQKSLARGQLLTHRWVEMLLYVATKQAEAEERRGLRPPRRWLSGPLGY